MSERLKLYNEEVSLKVLKKIILDFKELQEDMNKQIRIKEEIDEILNYYKIYKKNLNDEVPDLIEKINLFIYAKITDGIGQRTLYGYKLILNKFQKEFANRNISSISKVDLRIYIDKIAKNKKVKTINSYKSVLKNFFQWLTEEEYIIKNPMKNIHQGRVGRLILDRYTSEEIEKLRDSCQTVRQKALFELLESSACRISEIANMKVSNINWNEKSIKVIGKGNKERVVYISTRAKLALENYLGIRQGQSDYIFISLLNPYHKLTVRTLQLILQKIWKQSGIEHRVYAHKFRRTQATNLLNSGMSVVGVKKILGHESLDTTQDYCELSEQNVRNQYKRIIH